MRTQDILPIWVAFALICVFPLAVDARGQHCSLMRSYVDAGEILQHVGVETFPPRSITSRSQCQSACARYALTISANEMQQLAAMGGIAYVRVRCSYGEGGDARNAVIAQNQFPAHMLQVRRATLR